MEDRDRRPELLAALGAANSELAYWARRARRERKKGPASDETQRELSQARKTQREAVAACRAYDVARYGANAEGVMWGRDNAKKYQPFDDGKGLTASDYQTTINPSKQNTRKGRS